MNASGGVGPVLSWDVVLVIIIACLLASAFFSGCETGLMSVSRIRPRTLRSGTTSEPSPRNTSEPLRPSRLGCAWRRTAHRFWPKPQPTSSANARVVRIK